MQPNPLSLNLPALEHALDRYPVTVGADTSVVDAISMLGQARGISYTYPSCQELPKPSKSSQKQADCVLVIEQSQLVGMLTGRDIVRLSAFEIDLSKMTSCSGDETASLDRNVIGCSKSANSIVAVASASNSAFTDSR